MYLNKIDTILELSVKFVSQICHENINKPIDGAYLADFGIDINIRIANDAQFVCKKADEQDACAGVTILRFLGF